MCGIFQFSSYLMFVFTLVLIIFSVSLNSHHLEGREEKTLQYRYFETNSICVVATKTHSQMLILDKNSNWCYNKMYVDINIFYD